MKRIFGVPIVPLVAVARGWHRARATEPADAHRRRRRRGARTDDAAQRRVAEAPAL
jgi:hypothetical protein